MRYVTNLHVKSVWSHSSTEHSFCFFVSLIVNHLCSVPSDFTDCVLTEVVKNKNLDPHVPLFVTHMCSINTCGATWCPFFRGHLLRFPFFIVKKSCIFTSTNFTSALCLRFMCIDLFHAWKVKNVLFYYSELRFISGGLICLFCVFLDPTSKLEAFYLIKCTLQIG